MATLEQTRVLSTPRVYVDGRLIAVIPNSVKEDEPGEVSVRAVSAGGASVMHVSGLNAEEMKGRVGFTVATTGEMVSFVEEWRDRSNRGIPVTISVITSTRQRDYEQMFMTSKPEIAYEAEASIDLEFEGSLPATT